jgi:uncharacterized integral membrane protein (TIGR00698 family)
MLNAHPFPIFARAPAAGIAFVVLFACAAQQLAQAAPVAALGISPLIAGIVLGALWGNTLHIHLPASWRPGIVFSSKTLLRLAVVFYGFRVSLQDVASVGVEGFAAAAIMLVTTFALGAGLGIRLFRLPPSLALMIAAGSAVCGAAAVLATEPVVRAKPHESGIAVGTVVIFGTLAMLLYPLGFSSGLLGFDQGTYGLYAGASLHEVAHVVAAGRAVGPEAAANAVIVKMLRVMMLAPLLAVVGIALARRGHGRGEAKAPFPWFALGFLVCVAINSTHVVPAGVVAVINELDLFALTMAMCALGLETSLDKVRAVGARPFVLASCLALWLAVGGYWLTALIHRVFGTV